MYVVMCACKQCGWLPRITFQHPYILNLCVLVYQLGSGVNIWLLAYVAGWTCYNRHQWTSEVHWKYKQGLRMTSQVRIIGWRDVMIHNTPWHCTFQVYLHILAQSLQNFSMAVSKVVNLGLAHAAQGNASKPNASTQFQNVSVGRNAGLKIW